MTDELPPELQDSIFNWEIYETYSCKWWFAGNDRNSVTIFYIQNHFFASFTFRGTQVLYEVYKTLELAHNALVERLNEFLTNMNDMVKYE